MSKLTIESNKKGKKTSFKINNYNGSFGTIDSFKCKAIYIEICSYVIPENSYKKDIDKFKSNISRHMNGYIKNKFDGLKTFNIYSIDERQSNIERCEEIFSLLPIEITIVFDGVVNYKEHKEKYNDVSHEMVNYIQSYNKGLIFNHNNYK